MSKFYVIDPKISTKMWILEYARKQVSLLQSYEVNGNERKLIVSVPEPIPHHLTRTIKPDSIIISPCPMCNQFFHCKDIYVTLCGCTYHHWCLGFLLQIFKVCGRISHGEKFDYEWCKSIWFMLGNGKLEPQPSPPMLEGKFSTIWVSSDFFEVVIISRHYFFQFFLQSSKSYTNKVHYGWLITFSC